MGTREQGLGSAFGRRSEAGVHERQGRKSDKEKEKPTRRRNEEAKNDDVWL